MEQEEEWEGRRVRVRGYRDRDEVLKNMMRRTRDASVRHLGLPCGGWLFAVDGVRKDRCIASTSTAGVGRLAGRRTNTNAMNGLSRARRRSRPRGRVLQPRFRNEPHLRTAAGVSLIALHKGASKRPQAANGDLRRGVCVCVCVSSFYRFYF